MGKKNLRRVIKFVFVLACLTQGLLAGSKQKNVYIDIGTHARVKPMLRAALEQQGFTVIEQHVFDVVDDPFLFVSFEVRKENLPILQAHQDKKPILILFKVSRKPHGFEAWG